MPQPLLFELSDGVATLTLNRPERLNALNRELRVALRDALQQAWDDPEVRAVVVTGAGRAFCVGQDLRDRDPDTAAPRADAISRSVVEEYNPIASTLLTMPKPVVAMVNGPAAGAGAAIAFASDFRIMADDASYTMAFSGIGLTADTAASWTLPRLVGHAKATELLMLPSSVPAERALELGMANRVVLKHDLARVTREFARELAEGPTVALGAIKQSMHFGASHGVDETLALEHELQVRCATTQDYGNAVVAFLAKEQPVFRGV